jgi:hypothetical protein
VGGYSMARGWYGLHDRRGERFVCFFSCPPFISLLPSSPFPFSPLLYTMLTLTSPLLQLSCRRLLASLYASIGQRDCDVEVYS